MKIMKLRQNAVKKPRQNAVKNEILPELLSIKTQYGLQEKRNGGIEQNAVILKQNAVIEKLRGVFDVMKDRERAREEECEELQAKCEAAMTEFEKNATVVSLREKICTLSTESKEHKVSLDRMMLESQKWAGYQQSLLTLELKEVKELKHDRREVVSKAIPYVVIELAHSDDMGNLVDMKEPFDLSKVKGYHSSYKKDHIQAINDLATATFPLLDEFVVDPSALIKSLLSKKHPSLQ
ncbi:hypothetical protein Tco_0231658 [Tanacetum coccineum]